MDVSVSVHRVRLYYNISFAYSLHFVLLVTVILFVIDFLRSWVSTTIRLGIALFRAQPKTIYKIFINPTMKVIPDCPRTRSLPTNLQSPFTLLGHEYHYGPRLNRW